MKSPKQDDESRRSLLVARIIAASNIPLLLISALVLSERGHPLLWQWYLVLAISCVITIILMIIESISVLASGLITYACMMIAIFASVITSLFVLISQQFSSPFLPFQVSSLTCAIIALKPVWLGYLGISLMGIVPLILSLTAFSSYRSYMPYEEPWMTIVICIVSLVIYYYRLASSNLERKLAHTQAREEALGRLARIMIALRDLSNTPIQTLVVTTALLDRENMSKEEIIRLSKEALSRLSELSQLLEAYEQVVGSPQVIGSFDAIAVLKEEIESHKHQVAGKTV